MKENFNFIQYNKLDKNYSVELGNENTEDFKITFDDIISESDRIYYSLAACSGILCGGLDILFVRELNIDFYKEIGEKDAEKIVKLAAKLKGYDNDDLEGAVRYLEKNASVAFDKAMNKLGGPLLHHLNDLAHHPSIVGLICSILVQITKSAYGWDKDGKFIIVPLKDIKDADKLFGKNLIECVGKGAIDWLFHIASDIAGSGSTPGEGMGLPGPLGSLIRDLSTLPFIKEKTNEYIKYAYNTLRIDFRVEIGFLKNQSMPVIVNEVITRVLYSAYGLYKEIKVKEIDDTSNFDLIDLKEIMPLNNRTLTRMLTISSLVFVTMNGVKATIKSEGLIEMIPLHLNYVGLFRCSIAIINDSKYIVADLTELKRKIRIYRFRHKSLERKAIQSFEFFKISNSESRLLYSLQINKVLKDIENEKNEKKQNEKRKWLELYKNDLLKKLRKKPNYIIINEEILFVNIRKKLRHHWWRFNRERKFLFRLLIDLVTVTPYHQISDEPLWNIKYTYKYEQEYIQSITKDITFEKFRAFKKGYNEMLGKIQGKTLVETIIPIILFGAVAGVGGLVFAPVIAVTFVGPFIVGIHGAALTSASLALIGGGSLAAGGMGIAGGTAIIASGGALLGISGGGLASSAINVKKIPSSFVQVQATILVLYSKNILIDIYGNYKACIKIYNRLVEIKNEYSSNFIEISKDKSVDKKIIKNEKDKLKCVKNAIKEMEYLLKDYKETAKLIH